MKHTTFATMAMVVLGACDSPTPSDPTPEPLRAVAGEGVEASASGAAHRDLEGRPIVLNFSAARHADGRVTGSYYYRAVVQGVWIRVDVTCLSVVGNGAWVGGVIEDSSIPPLIGTVSYFYTFDNGEGSDAPSDVVSLVRAADEPGEDLVFCADRPTLLPDREVLHGNVNVRGG